MQHANRLQVYSNEPAHTGAPLARCAGALLCLLASCAFAHELPANRLTLVLRDRNHLSLTFFIDYTDAVHRALAPQRPLEEFVLMYSAMKPQDLGRELLRAQARLIRDTVPWGG